jgi:hypothetical protein
MCETGALSLTSPGWTGFALLLLSACQTEIVGGSAGAGPSGSGAEMNGGGGGSLSGGGTGATSTTGGNATGGAAGTGGAGAVGGSLDCNQPRAAAVPLRLLTESQYKNSVTDVLRVSGSAVMGLAPGLDDVALEQRANVAAAVATEAALNLAQWSPCTPPASGSVEPCEQQIIDVIGAAMYRRPLSDGERAEQKTLFDAGIREKDFATGVEWFLTGVLQSPDFTYEVVRPAPAETPGEIRRLSAHEYASRLSFFVWDGPPDAALSTAAANGALEDPASLDAEVLRMLEDPRFSRGIEQFYTRWLSMKGFDEIARDALGFDENVVAALSTSLLMSATEIYKSPSPNISSLFSGDTYFMNDVLGSFYGISGKGTTFTATSMPGEQRRGILTHPGMMALLARPGESFPIGRGLHVLRNVLCLVIAAPDGIEIPPLPPIQEGVSTRERLEAHTSSSICQGCHSLINPAGFAFESFDEVGRFRTMDHGRPIDSSGTLELGLSDIDGSFATGDALLEKLGQSQTVRACFAEKFLDFALARSVSDPADACSIRALGETFGASGDLKELVVSVAKSDSFRMRLAEGVGK